MQTFSFNWLAVKLQKVFFTAKPIQNIQIELFHHRNWMSIFTFSLKKRIRCRQGAMYHLRRPYMFLYRIEQAIGEPENLTIHSISPLCFKSIGC